MISSTTQIYFSVQIYFSLIFFHQIKYRLDTKHTILKLQIFRKSNSIFGDKFYSNSVCKVTSGPCVRINLDGVLVPKGRANIYKRCSLDFFFISLSISSASVNSSSRLFLLSINRKLLFLVFIKRWN